MKCEPNHNRRLFTSHLPLVRPPDPNCDEHTRHTGPGSFQGSALLYLYATCCIEKDITQKLTDYWHGNATTDATNP
jgi:hypothetical protein